MLHVRLRHGLGVHRPAPDQRPGQLLEHEQAVRDVPAAGGPDGPVDGPDEVGVVRAELVALGRVPLLVKVPLADLHELVDEVAVDALGRQPGRDEHVELASARAGFLGRPAARERLEPLRPGERARRVRLVVCRQDLVEEVGPRGHEGPPEGEDGERHDDVLCDQEE